MTADSIRITILVDNQPGPGLAAEHGFSLWIEAKGRRILFDTGQGGALGSNAATLGVDSARADILVLSHGHYDHTGGIAEVLRRNPGMIVYCHPGAVLPRYSIRDGKARNIAMPETARAALDRLPPESMHWATGPLKPMAGIGITGPIPRLTPFEDTGGPFFLDVKGQCPDPIDDDLALWIETGEGLIVCCGCCHSGLINTLRHIQFLTVEPRIRAVIGGFHLLNASDERLDQTVTELHSIHPALLVPCHCTGDGAIRRMTESFGDRAAIGRSGMELTF